MFRSARSKGLSAVRRQPLVLPDGPVFEAMPEARNRRQQIGDMLTIVADKVGEPPESSGAGAKRRHMANLR